MSNSEIPWDELFEGEIEHSTSNIAEIMQEYCDSIEKSSGGTVRARYDELRMATSVAGGTLFNAASVLLPHEEFYQANALSQRNINELYEPNTHVFDIFNDTYQFRLCDLTYGSMYPAEIEMDEGVQDEISEALNSEFELREPCFYILNSDDDLRSCFRLMVMSRKVRSILLQLRKG